MKLNICNNSNRRYRHIHYVNRITYDLCKEIGCLLDKLREPNPDNKRILKQIILKLSLIKKYERYLRDLRNS